MKMLVTGGSGYIGTKLCKVLGDDYKSYDVKNHPQENILNGPYLDYWVNWSDVVYHLASPCIIPESLERPFYYWENIYVGTGNVVSSCLKFDKRLVFTSTQVVEDRFRCETCGRLNSPYAEAKWAAERLIEKELTDYAIVRLPNVYDYEDKDPYRSRLIPRLRDSARKDGVVKIYPPITDVVELITLEGVVKGLIKFQTGEVGVFKLDGEFKTIGEVAEEVAYQFNAKVIITEEVRIK